MKPLTGLLPLLAACLLVVFFILIMSGLPAAHAYDDSIDTNTSRSSTLNTQQLMSLINQLAKQTNDTQGVPLSNDTEFQRLYSQLNSSLTSGNANETAANLLRLQNFTSSSSVTPGLLASLISSLQTSGNGLTVNPSELASLLSLGSDGLPNGLGPGSAKEQVGDLSSLASLVQNVNPQLAQELLNMANDISLNSGISVPSTSLTPSGGVNAVKGFQTPVVAPPKLAGAGSVGSDFGQLAFPVLVAAAALALFAARGRFGKLLRGQSSPGDPKDEAEPVDYEPTDPRKRILYYFYRATQHMRKKGVPKAAAETHREFAAKCGGKPDAPHIHAISTLYEKAKFSGIAATTEDAETARAELSSLESESTS